MTDQQIHSLTSKDGEVQLDVAPSQVAVWLNQSQTAEHYDSSTTNIDLQTNTFREYELGESAATEDYSIVRPKGDRQVRRRAAHYGPDPIYPLRSKWAAQFGQWANRGLTEHLIPGYILNLQRIAARGVPGKAAAQPSPLESSEQLLETPE